MKKPAALALLCAVLIAFGANYAVADPAFDQDMANRYMQAAQSGDDDAAFYVGALYSAGAGLPASDAEAFRWFSRAAEQGHSHAMLILAGLYATGRGVPKDNVNAYKWAYIVASASKVDEFRNGAGQLLGVLATKMTPEEIGRAKANASAWHAQSKGEAKVSPSVVAPSNPPAVAAASVPPAAEPARAPQAQPSPAATILPSPAPRSGNDQPEQRVSKGAKNDVGSLLDQVPPGLRKRFGF